MSPCRINSATGVRLNLAMAPCFWNLLEGETPPSPPPFRYGPVYSKGYPGLHKVRLIGLLNTECSINFERISKDHLFILLDFKSLKSDGRLCMVLELKS